MVLVCVSVPWHLWLGCLFVQRGLLCLRLYTIQAIAVVQGGESHSQVVLKVLLLREASMWPIWLTVVLLRNTLCTTALAQKTAVAASKPIVTPSRGQQHHRG